MTEIGNIGQNPIIINTGNNQENAPVNYSYLYQNTQNNGDIADLSTQQAPVPWYKKHAGAIIAGAAILAVAAIGFVLLKGKGGKKVESELQNGSRSFIGSGSGKPHVPEKKASDLIDTETGLIRSTSKKSTYNHKNHLEYFKLATTQEIEKYAQNPSLDVKWLNSFIGSLARNSSKTDEKVLTNARTFFNKMFETHTDKLLANPGSKEFCQTLENIRILGNDNQIRQIMKRFDKLFTNKTEGPFLPYNSKLMTKFIDTLSASGTNATKEEFLEKVILAPRFSNKAVLPSGNDYFLSDKIPEFVLKLNEKNIIKIAKSQTNPDFKVLILRDLAKKDKNLLSKEKFWKALPEDTRNSLKTILNEGETV